MATNSDYERAKSLGLTSIDRWGEGRDHHPMSVRLMQFLVAHDFNIYRGHFGWKIGDDGDNGETLMFQMDTFFALLDNERTAASDTSALTWSDRMEALVRELMQSSPSIGKYRMEADPTGDAEGFVLTLKVVPVRRQKRKSP